MPTTTPATTHTTHTTPDCVLTSVYGERILARLPLRRDEHLRAWDAADELIIDYFFETVTANNPLPDATGEQQCPANDDRMLLVNDNFGALACALNHYSPDLWSDSVTARESCGYNTEHNQLKPVAFINSIEQPPGYYRYVLIKLPKNNALLEQQLITLKMCIDSDTQVIAAGMTKHIQSAQFALFEKYLGTTTTSLAKKKARLLLVKPSTALLQESTENPYPSYYSEPSLDLTLGNHANVFSRRNLDIGSRFMIEQYNQLPRSESIVDLGCGNGVLGLVAKQRQLAMFELNTTLHFVDESYMAIDSSADNYAQLFSDECAQFHPSISLQALGLADIDLILCNPPFHQQHTIGDHIAWSMFQHSRTALRKGGVLWVIGNRHMNYHAKLKKVFNNCQTIASNKKFIVLAAVNR
ncbi:MAG: 23S rRNA (guanine1835-N2)-methyltransferase [Paraglaciecola psychrophila]|jgi:23S rRNA (guanine1835-N2)-methyltransferase